MTHLGWILIFVGGLIVAAGIVWLLAPAGTWLGRLPGDILVERENYRLYFPLTTCLLLSLLLTGVAWLIRYLLS